MSLIHKCTGFIGAVLLVFALGCASSGETTDSSSASITGDLNTVESNNPTMTLADRLRTVSGVYVQGSGSDAKVIIRGVQSDSGVNEPLFVVDGSRMGRSLARVAEQINVDDIESIRVLKGVEASSRYGIQGSAGAVIIRTKRK